MGFYQYSFDDMQFAEAVAKQLGRTAFIDECGNFGFDFEKEGVSPHYIVCAVITDNRNIPELEQKISAIREIYFESKEMKSSSIGSNHQRRAKVIAELLLLDFQLIILKPTGTRFKFISAEPLLSPLSNLGLHGIDWLIVGGESGPGSRPMQKEWVMELKSMCEESDTAFFFKQWGGTNRKKAGSLLNGREYKDYTI